MKTLLPVINRLTQKPDGFPLQWFRRVMSGARAVVMKDEGFTLPSCWIVRSSEKTQHKGIHEELVTISFEVIITIENARSHSPADTDEMMLAYRMAVKNRLLGFEPDTADCEPINYDGGASMGFDDGIFVWSDSYSFKCFVTNYTPLPTFGEPVLSDMTDPVPDQDAEEKDNG